MNKLRVLKDVLCNHNQIAAGSFTVNKYFTI
jgi:hypothetical protein